MSLVSIIIPVYNSEKYIERCLSSIENQSYENIEVLIINDGSQDNSSSIIESFIVNKPKYKYFIQENRGVSVSRNLGLDNSLGKYILFVDSDDYVDKDIVKDNVQILEENDGEIVVFGFNMINEDSGRVVQRTPKKSYDFLSNKELGENFKEIESEIDMNSLWNKMYKKEFIINNKIFFIPKKVGEDAVFNYRLYRKVSHILFNQNIYYHYTFEREDSAMNNYNPERLNEKIEVFKEKEYLYSFWGLEYKMFDTQLNSILFTEISIIMKRQYTYKEKIFHIQKLYNQLTTKEIMNHTRWKNIVGTKERIKYIIVRNKIIIYYLKIKRMFVFYEK